VSIIFFLNKILVVSGSKESNIRRIGWLLGAIGSVLAVVFSLMLHLYVFAVLQFGLIFLQGYGFLAKRDKNMRVEKLLNLIIFVMMVTLAYFLSVGILTLFELGGSIGILLGIYFLTHSNQKLGWILCAFGHGCTVYVMHEKSQYIFAIFQVLSIFVSIYGLFKKDNFKS